MCTSKLHQYLDHTKVLQTKGCVVICRGYFQQFWAHFQEIGSVGRALSFVGVGRAGKRG